MQFSQYCDQGGTTTAWLTAFSDENMWFKAMAWLAFVVFFRL
jgi:hypothetical protein